MLRVATDETLPRQSIVALHSKTRLAHLNRDSRLRVLCAPGTQQSLQSLPILENEPPRTGSKQNHRYSCEAIPQVGKSGHTPQSATCVLAADIDRGSPHNNTP